MKIYNYSDIPVIFDGVAITEKEIVLPQTIVKSRVTHNGHRFLTTHNDDRNSIFTISGDSSYYRYSEQNFPLPDIELVLVPLMISVFGFVVLIKIAQKLKTR